MRRQPDIENLYRIFRRERPARTTLFELFLNGPLYERLAGRPQPEGALAQLKWLADAFAAGGYDYCSTQASGMHFPTRVREHRQTVSLNEGFVITDEKSLLAYRWPEPEDFDQSAIEKIGPDLPDGMKLMIMGPCGVLENVIALCGYENLCYLLYEEPDVAKAVFDGVGSRLVRYYEMAAPQDSVGFLMSNDDWGFNTQTFLSPEMMRKYVFPWHKKIVDVGHRYGKPVALHSCGNCRDIIDDIVEMGYDAKHSYEDAILPVEQAYTAWHDRIALLGGIDVDFLIRSDVGVIRARGRAMIERTRAHGGWALGTGNSVPEYIPQEKYFAMTETAFANG